MGKKIITAALVIFVVAAVAVIAMQEWRKTQTGATPEQGTETTALDLPADGVVAFYLHGDRRCATCMKLEAYSQEAILDGFAEEIESGRLLWRTVNIDQPEHSHFVQDFELTNKSLVVAEYQDGKLVRWQNLALIWHLVGEKDAYLKYVRDGIREFTNEA